MLTGLEEKILKYLVGEDWPVTTEMVANEMKISWNTAQLHLYKLMAFGFAKYKRVGRQNQWIITEKGKKNIAQLRTKG